MSRTAYTENIIAYSNFLSKDECNKLINTFENGLPWLTVNGLTSIICLYSIYGCENETSPALENATVDWEFMSETLDRMQTVVEESFGKELSPSSLHLGRWDVGASMDYHSDNTDLEGNPSGFVFYKYASLIYLNDDYDGGRLEFRDHGFSLKPSAGTLVMFPGGIENVHRVTEVTEGKRYTLGSWWIDYND